MDEELELKDATQTLELYHIAGSPHADTLLMAYFPQRKNPRGGRRLHAGCRGGSLRPNLMENITKRKLRIDTIVPIHGTIAPFSDLQKVVGGT